MGMGTKSPKMQAKLSIEQDSMNLYKGVHISSFMILNWCILCHAKKMIAVHFSTVAAISKGHHKQFALLHVDLSCAKNLGISLDENFLCCNMMKCDAVTMVVKDFFMDVLVGYKKENSVDLSQAGGRCLVWI